jgi:hypothetical protein
MNGSDKLLFDTNLFIFYFAGVSEAKKALKGKDLYFFVGVLV